MGFRDPFVLRHGDRWLCVLGAGVPGRAMALLYSSADLRSWTYEGPMFERAGDADGAEATGEMWECPFLVPVGDRHVLGVSVWYGNEPFHTVAFVGRFDGRRLEPDLLARLDHGPDFYAPTAMVDPAGRTLLWGWSWDPSEPGVGHYDHGGCLTVTREVTLDGDDLRIRPVDKLATLRGERIGLHEGTVTEAAPVTLVEGPAAAFDLAARVDPAPGGRVEVELLASRDGRERTTIFIDRAEGVVGVDTTRSSLAGPGSHAIHIAPFKSAGTVEVRVLRDASLLEVFIEGHPFTVRVCPSSADIAIRLVAARRACRVRAEAWAITEQAIEVAP